MDCNLPGSSVHGISQARILEWVAISFSRGSSQPRARFTSLSLAEGFFTIELPGKPQINISDFLRPHGLQPSRLLCPWDSSGKNTREGCHALLQGIFLTQESNPHFLPCRQIFYLWATGGTPLEIKGLQFYTHERHQENSTKFWFSPCLLFYFLKIKHWLESLFQVSFSLSLSLSRWGQGEPFLCW